jgi:hypothetical protein
MYIFLVWGDASGTYLFAGINVYTSLGGELDASGDAYMRIQLPYTTHQ